MLCTMYSLTPTIHCATLNVNSILRTQEGLVCEVAHQKTEGPVIRRIVSVHCVIIVHPNNYYNGTCKPDLFVLRHSRHYFMSLS